MEFDETPHQTSVPPPFRPRDEDEKIAMACAIKNLLDIGAIRRCTFMRGQFLSSYFLISKSDGTYRFILNLKALNRFVRTTHFKMEDYRSACNLLFPFAFMAKIDLKEAYLTIPLDESATIFFRFIFEGQLYEFIVLPFGFNEAPYLFTKIMRPILNHLRGEGHLSVCYLDDWLLFGESYEACVSNVNRTIQLLQSLGWVVNFEKCTLTPCQTCTFLGFVFDSSNMTLGLPLEKRRKLANLLTHFSELRECKIRDFARLVGSLISVCPAMQYSWLYTKLFENEKYVALLASNNNYNARMKLSPKLDEDFT